MKKISSLLVKIMLIHLFLALYGMSYAQNPTYENRLLNDSLVDANTYEFDIYLLRTGSTTFELAAYQMGLYLNPDIVNGGTVTASIVSGSSTLSNPAQWPTSVSIGSGSSGQFCRAGLPYYIIRLQSKSPPGAGSGSIISDTYPGSRVCRIRLVNSVAFGQAAPIQCFNFASSPFNTIVRAYVGGTSTDITNQSWHYISDLTNPTLNLPVPVHTMTGGGITPVNVGLDGSDVGIRYWLYRDGVSTQWPTTGTGSAFNFNGSPFSLPGTYTSVGWRKATYLTANMTGSAFVCTPPIAYNVIGGGNYCTGGAGMMVGLADSDIGVIYQLKKDGSLYGSTQPGTGSQIEWADNPPGSYTVVANPGGGMCENTMNGTITITEIPLPTVYNVTGSGDYCSFGPVQVTLSGSQTSVGYQLFKNGVAEGTPVTGTGNPLSWPVTASGSYTVKASNLVPLPCETDMNGTAVITYNADKVLNLKFFLEGLYAGGSQMYPVSDGTNYVFGSNVADTFHIELVSYVNYPPVYKSFNSQLAIDGTVQIPVPCLLSGSYYIVIKHRNSVETWSKDPVSFSGTTINYNFSIAASQALGDNQQNLGGGVYGVYGGDENQDGAVDANDIGDIDNDASNFTMGYVVTDVNGDGIVDTNDMGLTDNNSSSFVIYVTPPAYGTPCPGLPQITDSRDGRVYRTVQIGNQCWLRENLNIGTRIDGLSNQTNNSIIEKYCHDNLESNCDVYGGLYQWNELMNYTTSSNAIPSGRQGICPIGWHVPSDAEWCQLEIFLDATVVCETNGWRGINAGGKMKETGTTHWKSPNIGATNSSGFTALNGGLKTSGGGFVNLTSETSFWSAAESSSGNAWYRGLYYNNGQMARDYYIKTAGFSGRCLKDCSSPPSPPSSGVHIPSYNQIIWNWEPVSGATGYKWNTSNDYNTATDMGTSTTKTETGLTCNTSYTRYVWAYNTCGNSSATILNQSTNACFTCGSNVIVNHVAGIVAPVSKTTTYGTVTNVPGEPTKCWITSNLGSDHQAISVDDATEASSGWYWQFNRKQGYKHDGTTRTPNTTWLTSIDEDLDWQISNDPCASELGTIWRIPTYTEWYNVDNIGSWTNWNDIWNSALKMHAAGYLSSSDGSLYNRGSNGLYRSSTQHTSTDSWFLNFFSSHCYMLSTNKADGFTLRCIKDAPNPSLPTLSTTSASNISLNTATSGGDIASDGGSPVTARGVCWNTSSNPTIANSHTSDGTGTGVFVSNITGLTANTLYYVRAYATNSVGTSYGDEITFFSSSSGGQPCSGFPTVNYGGKTYNTVQIGTQCWLRENLNIGNRIDGSLEQTNNVVIEKYCYNNLESNCDVYGGLYQWGEMVQYFNGATNSTSWNPVPSGNVVGICPSGWHIPTDDEWTTLTNYLGGDNIAGGKVKETGTTHWSSPNTGATNESGFTALPGGYFAGAFELLHAGTYLWSSTEGSQTEAWHRFFGYDMAGLVRGLPIKTVGCSVRCLKDCISPPSPPSSGIHIPASTSILWNWNSVPDATGYKWNIVNDYFTAIDMGLSTSKTETELTCNTQYTRYVWAYNLCGYSTPVALTQSTLACWTTCGDPITVNHIASGGVAPVDKSVTYGTVTNVPGEATKCWITRNLGASQQATAVDDATEESAGWYWQFSRKQGFKHDGTTRTPNTTWISSIDENSDWATANDPCTIELGAGWRIPTSSEWTNVDASGSWTNWNGPWNSLLKMHAAGRLTYSNGSLYGRGSSGYYWSSTQHSNTNGGYLYFTSSNCNMYGYNKANGFSLRCIRD